MLISTPETLQAMLTGSKMRVHLQNIRYLVIDEVHELAPSKRGLQLTVGLERLRELAGEVQMLCMSATIGSPRDIVKFFSMDRRKFRVINVSNRKRIRIGIESPRPEEVDSLSANKLAASEEVTARVRRIRDIIREKESVLAFTNTREFSEILSSRLRALDRSLPIETHHSSLSSNVRISSEKGFRDRKIKALICTSSLELGIDIGSIEAVVQYMSPRQVSKLLQRVGRSGHSLEKVSEGVIISTDPDDSMECAAIASLSRKGWIEPTKPYNGAWDVLAGQILGLSLDYYKIPLEKAFDIVRRAYPYRNLKFEDFALTARLLQKLGLLWVDSKFETEPLLKRRGKTFLHYYQNLSTIPDTKTYTVFDVVSDRPVGSLDAEFIALHGQQGTSFIVKGQAWRILDVRTNRVLVEPLPGILGAIPAWEGELIPVPFEVSQEVGKIRRDLSRKIRTLKRPRAIQDIIRTYKVTRDVAEKMYGSVKKQVSWGFLPDDRNVLIEYYSDGEESWVVIHSCWGSMVNETLGRVLAAVLIKRIGSVGLQVDPYRIMFKLQHLGDWKDVVDAFQNIMPEDIDRVLGEALPGTELFTWRFIHVAKRFGIIARDAEFGKGYIRKITEVYDNTPPVWEALNEVLQEKLDAGKTREVVRDLRKKRFGVKVMQGISPLGTSGIQKRYEIVAPDRPEREIFDTFRKRLLETKTGLVCMQCGEHATIKEAGEVPEEISCPACSAKLISSVPSRYLLEAQELVRKKKAGKALRGEEARYYDQMHDSASLVLSSGKNAVIALSGRGVGVRTAGRILAKPLQGDDLFHEILKAEKNYAKTKRFWKLGR
jgi:ATP-dependent Lhr-like helicase